MRQREPGGPPLQISQDQQVEIQLPRRVLHSRCAAVRALDPLERVERRLGRKLGGHARHHVEEPPGPGSVHGLGFPDRRDGDGCDPGPIHGDQGLAQVRLAVTDVAAQADVTEHGRILTARSGIPGPA